MSEQVRREVAESPAQGCFSHKQEPAGSKRAPYGFPFVLVVALTSWSAPLWENSLRPQYASCKPSVPPYLSLNKVNLLINAVPPVMV